MASGAEPSFNFAAGSAPAMPASAGPEVPSKKVPRELRNLVIPARDWTLPPQHGQAPKEPSAAAAPSLALPPLDPSASAARGDADEEAPRGGTTPLVDVDEQMAAADDEASGGGE